MNPTHLCPVCGYDALDDAAYDDDAAPSFEICSSCGFQFGVSDLNDGFTFEKWRNRWIRDGCPWQSIGVPEPEGWNPREQLKKL